jgi:signal transduction histidine kinase
VRVLGHEINNSLAPIQSIAATLRRGVGQGGADFDEDLAGGLDVIARRSEGLARFLAAYTRLARLPPPRLGEVAVAGWVQRVVALETRKRVVIEAGPDAVLRADGDQLDQLLINLVRNAADTADGAVVISWTVDGGVLDLLVRDDGAGVADTANLFVPFFTTKPGGSGIGLALSRQITEAHGGTLVLQNRTDGRRGGEARVRLWDARAPKRTIASGEVK